MMMMYRMKNIIVHDDEITLPKCMYTLKPKMNSSEENFDIRISNQVIKFLKAPNSKMAELEQRQDQLLKKLDVLYDRIKTISSYCKTSSNEDVKIRKTELNLPTPEEVVLVLSPESLPWYLNVVLKDPSLAVNISWHIHSSVSNDKVAKIKSFVNKLHKSKTSSKINLRLIFKSVSADTELKLSSLAVPVIGNVNILRYLSFAYPSAISYDTSDHHVDSLLDLCHMLERANEKSKEAIIHKLFALYIVWIYGNEVSIVDLAVYNVIKQLKSVPKCVPKAWFDKCDKLCF